MISDSAGEMAGGGLAEHLHEPVDFYGQGGIADVGLGSVILSRDGPVRVDDDLAFRIHDDEERIARISAVKRCSERNGTGGIAVALIAGAFADIEAGDNEVLVHDGASGG